MDLALFRIYERLRKRSYRRKLASDEAWAAWNPLDDVDVPDDYTHWEHEAYVRGVREALRAVQHEDDEAEWELMHVLFTAEAA